MLLLVRTVHHVTEGFNWTSLPPIMDLLPLSWSWIHYVIDAVCFVPQSLFTINPNPGIRAQINPLSTVSTDFERMP
jgi:hypothetical protein